MHTQLVHFHSGNFSRCLLCCLVSQSTLGMEQHSLLYKREKNWQPELEFETWTMIYSTISILSLYYTNFVIWQQSIFSSKQYTYRIYISVHTDKLMFLSAFHQEVTHLYYPFCAEPLLTYLCPSVLCLEVDTIVVR